MTPRGSLRGCPNRSGLLRLLVVVEMFSYRLDCVWITGALPVAIEEGLPPIRANGRLLGGPSWTERSGPLGKFKHSVSVGGHNLYRLLSNSYYGVRTPCARV
jgi:hypothetical protein